MLNSDNIDFIIKDLHKRGILMDELRDEIIDHVCSAVEEKMKDGDRFVDAYEEVIESFGNTQGLQETQKQSAMLQNYFTVAFRNLKKQSFYTFINVAGLAVGVASCLIIMLYVFNELSYDKHFKDHERIYRVESEILFGDNHLVMAVTPAPLAETLRKDFPEVDVAARMWNRSTRIFRKSDESFKEANSIMGDSSLFKVFDIPFVEGQPGTALREPYTMVISRAAAEKYFPNESALGQTLITNDKNWKITGVFEDLPTNTHFKMDFILSLVTSDYNKDGNWLSNNFYTYVKLKSGVDSKALEAKFPKMVDMYAGPQASAAFGADFTMEKFRASGNKLEFTLINVADIHLYSDRAGEVGVNSNVAYVYLFGAIAAFILIIACINFMNLSTARSSNRAKEVGIRKVMGSFRSHLVRQFLMESIMLSVISFVIAVVVAWIFLPMFNSLALKDLMLPFGSPFFWLALIGATLLTGMLAGLYPAFFLSSFTPASVLKGNVSRGTRSGIVRGALVIFQFWISIVLIVGTIAVNQQLSYIQNKKIGFNKDQVIVIKDAYALKDQLQSFKNEVEKDNRIKSGTIAGSLPVKGTDRNDNAYWMEGKSPTDENLISIQTWSVDHDYIKTLGMKIVDGRDFSRDFLSDSGAVILNQAASKAFGIMNDPIGKKIQTYSDVAAKTYDVVTIVGVVENFHFESLRENIGPVALFLQPNESTGRISFRYEAKNTDDVISMIEQNWRKLSPGVPFDYTFLDEDFGRMYSAEQRLGEIFTIFAGLAIVIACLGLFALTAFTAEQRTKEIGIRKVLGASVSGIVVLLSKEFGKLIVIAFVFATPVAWFGINKWLESYTYRTEVAWWVYVVAGLSAFVVAWLTMSYQSIKAAITNPIKSLRSE